MKVIKGIMARRMLINWRIDWDAAAACVPAGVRPARVKGYAIAGLCMVQLEKMRPAGMPEWLSMGSENVAARMAVEVHGHKTVMIFRRDTGSWVNAFVGGRLFPGVHHRATFLIHEDDKRVAITMRSADGTHTIDVAARESDAIMEGSVFGSIDDAIAFFRGGETGYSPGTRQGEWEGVRLACSRWDLRPMRVEHVASSFIEDALRFPRGSAQLDSVFIMRNIEHTWTALPRVGWGTAPVAAEPAEAWALT